MALAHKGVSYHTRATAFTAIAEIPGSQQKTLPTIQDGDKLIADSLAIACYLEEKYDGPSLFAGSGGIAGARFFQNWIGTIITPQMARLLLVDIYNHVLPEDQAYFRTSREQRFGMSLEDAVADRKERRAGLREALLAARLLLRKQTFLGGEQPLHLDYQLFGVLQWARVISDFRVLDDDDPVLAWFRRCLDLHDGLGRTAPGYWQ